MALDTIWSLGYPLADHIHREPLESGYFYQLIVTILAISGILAAEFKEKA